ncbi:hypothetical protein EOD39_13522 [Acipenser ruthenus]|uniref:Uncharacterized protein n=1 Tax=Acipenser ruthenus TaxID=7906 RepID=A0A444UIE5_ACIRT|nr:hypothetical protein EOD39_13522 [Acipenser ruthenus]
MNEFQIAVAADGKPKQNGGPQNGLDGSVDSWCQCSPPACGLGSASRTCMQRRDDLLRWVVKGLAEPGETHRPYAAMQYRQTPAAPVHKVIMVYIHSNGPASPQSPKQPERHRATAEQQKLPVVQTFVFLRQREEEEEEEEEDRNLPESQPDVLKYEGTAV